MAQMVQSAMRARMAPKTQLLLVTGGNTSKYGTDGTDGTDETEEGNRIPTCQ